MQITSQFTIAVHIIAAVDYFSSSAAVTSSFLAGSIGANPVIVRNVMGKLKEAGILEISQGRSGIVLAKPLEEISLFDIYQALDCVSEEGLFHFHENPNANCPVGRNIHKAMDARLAAIQGAMETQMKQMSLAEVVADTRKEIAEEGSNARETMREFKTQEERLDYLVEAFKEDAGEYGDLPTPADPGGKRRMLRSLMNIRMPREMAAETLTVQDDYLRQRIREHGIVGLADIPSLADQGSTIPHGSLLSLWQGDITRLSVDAIVNAANAQMLGCFVPMHTCIDNCIHTFAGVQLRAECNRQMNRLRARYGRDYEQPTAVPMLTDGYNLPAKKVVHIVGPIVSGMLTPALEEALAACYRNTLDLCVENGLRSVAFCCISTGVFHFPADRAARIAVRTVTQWLDGHGAHMDRVIFNVFSEKDRDIYERLLY